MLAPAGFADDLRMRRFFKGIFKLRPVTPKYDYMWDPKIVLDHMHSLGDNDTLTLGQLASKLATLLILTTTQRIQTLSLIQIQNIEEEKEGLIIKIPLPTKTSRKGATQPSMFLPYFTEDVHICVASTLKQYLAKTENLRPSSTDRLFICNRQPYHQVTTQTLSRWIQMLLRDSGLDTSKFSAYSTRHAAVSKAYKRGVSIDVIRKAAGWSNTSQTFARFYNRPCVTVNRDHLARTIVSQ